MQKRVLVFGGGFSPPTLAHEAIIAECLALPGFDEVWVLLSGDRLDKLMTTSDEHRLRMVEIVKQTRFSNNPRLHISDFELQLPRPTETYQTTQALAAAFPEVLFCYVFGTDSYLDMPNWSNGLALRSLPMVIIARQQEEPVHGPTITNMTLPGRFAELSSTAVRERLRRWEPLNGLVSRTVADYIAARHLFVDR